MVCSGNHAIVVGTNNNAPVTPGTGNPGPPDVACDGATRPHPADECCMDDAIYGGISVNGALDSPS